MRELGFTDVKLWVQWRWSHRAPESYAWGDVDRLMDLAQANGLRATINAVFDVTPLWLFELYPDAKQIDASGRVIEPYTVAHRQVGGHPGPCYNHPGAREMRQRFMAAALDHYRGHPALAMWDVWNEPEQSFPSRAPDVKTLVCYCPHCRAGFIAWLRAKYGDLARLNAVWGRWYDRWEQIELPVNGSTLSDFIDWREFHLDTMTAEARWRLDMTGERDPRHARYLHVVPNVMSVFSSVTCVDDFDLAEHCDVFAATMNGGPILATQVTSAARGKVCYNVESHINHGCTDLHQRFLGMDDVLRDFLPQIGLGIKGFLFWQYRPEVLGFESPAWGVVQLDGSDRPVTRAVEAFGARILSQADGLLTANPRRPQIGIWKSRKNEVFHFATQNTLKHLVDSVEGYIQALYWHNYPFRIVSDAMLAAGDLDDLKLLILPSPYCLAQPEADALDGWVRQGGVVLSEAHLGGYDATAGRHSRILPGCGLARRWGIREADSTSSYHLRLNAAGALDANVTEDVRKALREFGVSGGQVFPFAFLDGALGWGAHRYAALDSIDGLPMASFDGQDPLIVSRPVGDGWVFYCGANLGQAASLGQGDATVLTMLRAAAGQAGLAPLRAVQAELPGTAHLDILESGGAARYAVLVSRADRPQAIRLDGRERWRGVFTGQVWNMDGALEARIPERFVELFRVEEA
jgi:beta-galactosidase